MTAGYQQPSTIRNLTQQQPITIIQNQNIPQQPIKILQNQNTLQQPIQILHNQNTLQQPIKIVQNQNTQPKVTPIYNTQYQTLGQLYKTQISSQSQVIIIIGKH